MDKMINNGVGGCGNDVAIDEYTAHEVKTIDNAFDTLVQKERHEAIQRCIDRLPSDDNFILTLYYFEELTLEEISEITGVNTNNLKVI